MFLLWKQSLPFLSSEEKNKKKKKEEKKKKNIHEFDRYKRLRSFFKRRIENNRKNTVSAM